MTPGSTPISAARVRSVVEDALGVRVTRVARVPGSVANQDFVVDRAGGPRLVLKAGPRAEIAAEAWACERLQGLGVPVPQVLLADLDGVALGSPHLVARFVPGEPSDDADVLRETGAWVRRVHEVRLPGWGPLVVSDGAAGPTAAAGRHPSRRDHVLACVAELPALVAAGVLDQGLADAATACVTVEDLHDDGPGVLLHHDLKPPHLFAVRAGGRRRLSAIIDWGDACVGDPLADVARLSMTGPAATTAFLDGYGLRLTDEVADRLARHRVLWNTRALAYELRAGGDWFSVYRSRVQDDVARLLG